MPTSMIARTSGPRLCFRFLRRTGRSSGASSSGSDDLRPFAGGGTSVPSDQTTSFTFGGDTTAASTTPASPTSGPADLVRVGLGGLWDPPCEARWGGTDEAGGLFEPGLLGLGGFAVGGGGSGVGSGGSS